MSGPSQQIGSAVPATSGPVTRPPTSPPAPRVVASDDLLAGINLSNVSQRRFRSLKTILNICKYLQIQRESIVVRWFSMVTGIIKKGTDGQGRYTGGHKGFVGGLGIVKERVVKAEPDGAWAVLYVLEDSLAELVERCLLWPAPSPPTQPSFASAPYSRSVHPSVFSQAGDNQTGRMQPDSFIPRQRSPAAALTVRSQEIVPSDGHTRHPPSAQSRAAVQPHSAMQLPQEPAAVHSSHHPPLQPSSGERRALPPLREVQEFYPSPGVYPPGHLTPVSYSPLHHSVNPRSHTHHKIHEQNALGPARLSPRQRIIYGHHASSRSI